MLDVEHSTFVRRHKKKSQALWAAGVQIKFFKM